MADPTINPDEVRRLLTDTEPRPPLLADGTVPLDSDGNCTACGWKTAAYVPDGPDHGPGCPADREYWRLVDARAALSQAAPTLARAYLYLARVLDNPGDIVQAWTPTRNDVVGIAHAQTVVITVPSDTVRDRLRERLAADRAGGSDV